MPNNDYSAIRRYRRQTHNHQYLGNTSFADENNERHSHNFSGLSSEAIPYNGSHIHRIKTGTTFILGHYHEIYIVTGPAIPVGYGKHIHLVKATTTFVEGHIHEIIFTTLID